MVKVLCYKLLNKIIDVFFNDFFCNEFKGVFLGNVQTDQEDYEMFHNWVETMLYRTDLELNIVKPY